MRLVGLIGLGMLVAGCAGGAAAANAGRAETGRPDLPPVRAMVSLDAVVIVDSGSTNTYGYTIVLGRDGQASYTSGQGRGAGSIPSALATKLFGDVAAAQPLDSLAVGHCAKSVSFGTSLTLENQGKTSPDLTCAADATGQALLQDAHDVARQLCIGEVPRSSGSPPPPLPIL